MELKTFLDLAKEYKVKRLKCGDIEVEFDGKIYQESQAAPNLGITPERMPTEDELLFWSSNEQIDVEAKPPEES